ncbi:DUF948 domain-containing protein [Lactiplantibacillus modestisalitolerans]|uniref:DUF948 domain-containing protein n=1 Tax=Lactiplantibacillus modestisalitolerans TaxID=1457219 RepID=A0ABV5WVF8_9LACO|nr:DUF948 domain-containing protein [Lactiplantibacillus modestisalitolerans]
MITHVAGIIAAIAFLLLVCFIGIFLMRITKTMGEVNRSLNTITDDVDALSHQTEKIMANANELLKDVNGKVASIDPAFQAMGDLGQSVSDLNAATRELTAKVGHNNQKRSKFTSAGKVGKAAFDVYRNRRSKKNSEES